MASKDLNIGSVRNLPDDILRKAAAVNIHPALYNYLAGTLKMSHAEIVSRATLARKAVKYRTGSKKVVDYVSTYGKNITHIAFECKMSTAKVSDTLANHCAYSLTWLRKYCELRDAATEEKPKRTAPELAAEAGIPLATYRRLISEECMTHEQILAMVREKTGEQPEAEPVKKTSAKAEKPAEPPKEDTPPAPVAQATVEEAPKPVSTDSETNKDDTPAMDNKVDTTVDVIEAPESAPDRHGPKLVFPNGNFEPEKPKPMFAPEILAKQQQPAQEQPKPAAKKTGKTDYAALALLLSQKDVSVLNGKPEKKPEPAPVAAPTKVDTDEDPFVIGDADLDETPPVPAFDDEPVSAEPAAEAVKDEPKVQKATPVAKAVAKPEPVVEEKPVETAATVEFDDKSLAEMHEKNAAHITRICMLLGISEADYQTRIGRGMSVTDALAVKG